jgi:uncharacterized membrane protein YhiD involved in acid resistance
MKLYVELFLVAVLLVLMYERPEPLVKFSNSTLGKIILVLAVLGIAHSCGMTAGVLSAFIVIVLKHTWREGLENSVKKTSPKTPSKKNKPTKEGVSKSSTTQTGQTNKQCSSNLDCSSVQKCKNGVCVSGTDQVGLDRQMKSSAETNTLAATSQENMHTG